MQVSWCLLSVSVRRERQERLAGVVLSDGEDKRNFISAWMSKTPSLPPQNHIHNLFSH